MPTKDRWSQMTEEQKAKEKARTFAHQKANREYWRELNRTCYLSKVGELKRESPLTNTVERIAERARNKANARATRAKMARFPDELTDLVIREAHSLRKLRNKLTNTEWHVDHIIPLKGKLVSGLHIWNNLAVIPKVENLRKGNSYSIHED